ncbi:MAG: pyridoxamine 5'-phosphate oxidase family protein [Dehalococcoidia bacterium]|nr:pyridoxamine 5'-phosphate oxidase family protein [Dehalococcoidia bacterium]
MDESPRTLAHLQWLIDDSVRVAGAAIRRNFVAPGWTMNAREFVEFWGTERLAVISTASARGLPHAVPVDVRLRDGKFYVATFPNSRRLRDHRERAACVITAFDDTYHAAIVYGQARVVGDDASELSEGRMVTVEIEPTRIYAIRHPSG